MTTVLRFFENAVRRERERVSMNVYEDTFFRKRAKKEEQRSSPCSYSR